MSRRLTHHDVVTEALGIEFKAAPCGCDACSAPPEDAFAVEAKRHAELGERIALAEDVARFKALQARFEERGAWAPLPARFVPIYTFARMELGIDAREAPAVKMVPASALRPGVVGLFDMDENTMLIRADVDAAEVEATICHEMGHAFERKHRRSRNENFADRTERELMRKWQAYR